MGVSLGSEQGDTLARDGVLHASKEKMRLRCLSPGREEPGTEMLVPRPPRRQDASAYETNLQTRLRACVSSPVRVSCPEGRGTGLPPSSARGDYAVFNRLLHLPGLFPHRQGPACQSQVCPSAPNPVTLFTDIAGKLVSVKVSRLERDLPSLQSAPE